MTLSFNKSNQLFPIKQQSIHFNHCGISPLYQASKQRIIEFTERHANANLSGYDYLSAIDKFHQAGAQLLNTDPHNIAYLHNTAEGIGMIANGYPFQVGDKIISYTHEYPSNHYAWKIQEQRGAQLVLLNNVPAPQQESDKPYAWSFDELTQLIDEKVKLISISHVQFTSGYAADLQQLGTFCYERDIDLVVDAAQSFGCLELKPDEWHISAIATSGWKWLMGPIGSGLLYTSPSFRKKLAITLAGPEVMQQGEDYLNHQWQPFADSRRFEFSTLPPLQVEGLACSLNCFNQYGMSAIQQEIFRLQDYLLNQLDQIRYQPVSFAPQHRSGIIALNTQQDPLILMKTLQQQGITCSARGGYLRLAPHFYNDETEIDQAIHILNTL